MKIIDINTIELTISALFLGIGTGLGIEIGKYIWEKTKEKIKNKTIKNETNNN